jgi:hypothetical protein
LNNTNTITTTNPNGTTTTITFSAVPIPPGGLPADAFGGLITGATGRVGGGGSEVEMVGSLEELGERLRERLREWDVTDADGGDADRGEIGDEDEDEGEEDAMSENVAGGGGSRGDADFDTDADMEDGEDGANFGFAGR